MNINFIMFTDEANEASLLSSIASKSILSKLFKISEGLAFKMISIGAALSNLTASANEVLIGIFGPKANAE